MNFFTFSSSFLAHTMTEIGILFGVAVCGFAKENLPKITM
jgi:hypothetical protein